MTAAVRVNRAGRRQHQPTAGFDYALLACVIGLLAFGLIMVASSSMAIGTRCCADPFHFFERHLVALILALGAAVLAYQMPLQWWSRSGMWMFLLMVVVLVMLLVPGIGRTVNGATRWIALGPFNFQPSEFAKLFAVIYISGYLVRHSDDVRQRISGFIRPMILVGIAAALILMEPDFGTTAVMLATVMVLLFLGGASLQPFIVLLGTVAAGMVAMVMFSSYRMSRVVSFLDPWADPENTGYQLAQALIAFGRGGWSGVGLGNGIQKQYFLPEAHTDFLASVIGEELGLIGMLVLICAFAFLTWRAFAIGARAQALNQFFASYVAQGIGFWIGVQAVINIGVNVGMLPTKGLTLPFISYGSNSLIVSCMAIALLLRIDVTLRRLEAAEGVPGRRR